jgi:hypothetical protein
MLKKDTIVWEIVGEAFWLVALVGALVFGLISQVHATIPSNDRPGGGEMVQSAPVTIGSVISVDPIRIGK